MFPVSRTIVQMEWFHGLGFQTSAFELTKKRFMLAVTLTCYLWTQFFQSDSTNCHLVKMGDEVTCGTIIQEFSNVLGPTAARCEYGKIWSVFVNQCVKDFRIIWIENLFIYISKLSILWVESKDDAFDAHYGTFAECHK